MAHGLEPRLARSYTPGRMRPPRKKLCHADFNAQLTVATRRGSREGRAPIFAFRRLSRFLCRCICRRATTVTHRVRAWQRLGHEFGVCSKSVRRIGGNVHPARARATVSISGVVFASSFKRPATHLAKAAKPVERRWQAWIDLHADHYLVASARVQTTSASSHMAPSASWAKMRAAPGVERSTVWTSTGFLKGE
jgi:hypothetical protein